MTERTIVLSSNRDESAIVVIVAIERIDIETDPIVTAIRRLRILEGGSKTTRSPHGIQMHYCETDALQLLPERRIAHCPQNRLTRLRDQLR